MTTVYLLLIIKQKLTKQKYFYNTLFAPIHIHLQKSKWNELISFLKDTSRTKVAKENNFLQTFETNKNWELATNSKYQKAYVIMQVTYCMHTRILAFLHAWTLAYYIYMHTYILAKLDSCLLVYLHTCILPYLHTCKLTYIQRLVLGMLHTCIRHGNCY